jgi:hypothetical protein
MAEQKETITIEKDVYDDLTERSKWLGYLEMAGVDNWQGIEFAVELRNADRKKEGEQE